jgi:hypothetical protein
MTKVQAIYRGRGARFLLSEVRLPLNPPVNQTEQDHWWVMDTGEMPEGCGVWKGEYLNFPRASPLSSSLPSPIQILGVISQAGWDKWGGIIPKRVGLLYTGIKAWKRKWSTATLSPLLGYDGIVFGEGGE